MIEGIFKIIFAILLFLIILALAYFTSKFVAKNSTKLNNGKNMEIIDVLNLGNNKKIIMVKIIDKIYVLGISNTEINTIDTFDSEGSIEKLIKDTNYKPNFESFLKDKLTVLKAKKNVKKKYDLKNIDYNNVNSLKEKIEHLKENKLASRKKDED